MPAGRDAAGKDGTINHVLTAMNPQGCSVTGLKVPSKEEAAHDFMWRYHKVTPEKGHVAISQIVIEALESLNMKFPEPAVDINEIKKKYHEIVVEEEANEKRTIKTKKGKAKS